MNGTAQEEKSVSPQDLKNDKTQEYATQHKKDDNQSAITQDLSPKNANAKIEQEDKNAEGTKLGSYVFGKSLGKGTFGKVKLGIHTLTGELVSLYLLIIQVAIKILEKARIKDKKDIERISREIKILKKVRHPNVIQLYEVIQIC